MAVTINRKDIIFYPDPSRVIARFLYNGDERSLKLVQKVLDLSDEEIKATLSMVLRDFSKRHRNISKIFESHFNRIKHLFDRLGVDPEALNLNRKVLIGSYFTMEYSIESAAFFNPSIVTYL